MILNIRDPLNSLIRIDKHVQENGQIPNQNRKHEEIPFMYINQNMLSIIRNTNPFTTPNKNLSGNISNKKVNIFPMILLEN